MLEKYYLVTVLHMTKKTMVQYLIIGSIEDARSLMAIIGTRVYRQRVKYLSCTITEIMNDKINVYFWGDDACESRYRSFNRSLDKDIFLFHLYARRKDEKIHGTSVTCMGSIEEFFPPPNDDNPLLTSDNCDLDVPSMFCTANKISFRGVSYVDFDDDFVETETRIEFVKASHCPCCGQLEVEENLRTIKLA